MAEALADEDGAKIDVVLNSLSVLAGVFARAFLLMLHLGLGFPRLS